MVKPEKIQRVENIKKILEGAKGVYFADFTGLSVAEITDLRRRLREKGVVFKVVRNTMARIAMRDLGYSDELLEKILHGPNALVVGYDDAIEPVKVLFEFKKEFEKPQVRAGFVEGEFYDAEGVERLSKLPGKDELRAKVVGALNAPIYSLVFSLKSMLNSLVWTLNAIKDKKEKEEG